MRTSGFIFGTLISLLAVGGIVTAVRGIHLIPPTPRIATTTPPQNDVSLSEHTPAGTEPSNPNTEDTISTSSMLTVTQPTVGARVSNPLIVTGNAQGTWFFEASFPVTLLDGNGNVLTQGIAQAQDEWMTEDFVPFAATLSFATSSTATGTLRLQKDNPSGLPEHDAHLDIPVTF